MAKPASDICETYSKCRFFDNLNIDDVKKKLTLKLHGIGISNKDIESTIELTKRIGVTTNFLVYINNNSYITDPNVSTLLPYSNRNFLTIQSNGIDTHDILFDYEKMSSYLAFVSRLDFLPVVDNIKNTNPKKHFYVFFDVTCPKCKRFHKKAPQLTTKHNIKFTYIPVLRNTNDKISEKANLMVYCKKESVANKLEELIEFPAKKIKQIVKSAGSNTLKNCDKNTSSIVQSLLSQGNLLNIQGTPLFVSDDLDYFYGESSLLEYITKNGL
jgi:hypothetical protein